jgi:hypothetical protein
MKIFLFSKKRGQAFQAVQNAAGIAKSVVGFGRLGADTSTAMDGLMLSHATQILRRLWEQVDVRFTPESGHG